MKRVLPVWCKEMKKALIDKDMTVTQLSEEIHVNRTMVSCVLSGRTVSPEVAEIISKHLGVKIPYTYTVN